MIRKVILAIVAIVLSHNIFAYEGEISLADSTKRESIKSYIPKIIGRIDVRYDYDDSGEPTNQFEINRARIGMVGTISNKISYKFQGDFAEEVRLLDAYVEFEHSKKLKFKVGQFKLPIVMDNTISSYVYSTIDRSESTKLLVGYSDSLRMEGSNRDIGAYISGDFLDRGSYSVISYKAGVVNGSGMNLSDANSGKEGFVAIDIKPTESITIAGSFIGGHTGETGVSEYVSNRWSFGAMYEGDKLMARSEYINAKTGELRSDGFYAIAEYDLAKSFSVVGRYNIFRRNIYDSELNENYYTAGINYIFGRHLRAQLNYTYAQMYQQGYNMAGVQVKVAF